jgi:3-methylcrotonyl-CoA carboxylase alpha subunit
MFTKILIANRGEIACRVAATARRMGIRTVAVYSDADASAAHVQACDEAVHIGTAPTRESYLRADRILAAAQATGAQAIHPGYGFLSENADFAQACEERGIAFIGPPASAMAAMGDKSAAKALMARAGVPLVPGYHGDVQDTDFLQAQANAIGYPVLIKASAGGGGKGMRVVTQAADFAAALASCQREASASFGNDQVLIERYLRAPRHIEIQVFGDQQGQYVYLFERDCSVQRRHQKVLEEAPAPGMTPARRQQMGETAVAAARSVGYEGAGTVEFICETHDADEAEDGNEAHAASQGRFYFMEMNTRLQVEHPVTEAITGLDLVEWQLRVAAGEPLPLRQEDLQIKGHAIEARLCAENPAQQFLPSTGPLRVLRLPDASAFEVAPVRVDSGVREGDAISPCYDSMIAKLIVWGDTRDAALARLDAALGQVHITGLHTNVAFVRRVINTASFAQARLDTGLIEHEHEALFEAAEVPEHVAVGAAMACLMRDQGRSADQHGDHPYGSQSATPGGTWHMARSVSPAANEAIPTRQITAARDPWAATDGWRLHGAAQHCEVLQVGDQSVMVVVRMAPPGHAARGHTVIACDLQYLDQALPLLVYPSLQPDTLDISLAGQRIKLSAYRHGDGIDLFTPQGHARITRVDPLSTQGDAQAPSGGLKALMPGKVIALFVKAGQAVKRGEALAVTEAMKMEHTLTAPQDGVVASILCAVGDQVGEGAELLRIA